MFKGVHYVSLDYMYYIQDGWLTFAYWKPQFTISKTTKLKSDQQASEATGLNNNNEKTKTDRTRLLKSNETATKASTHLPSNTFMF